MKSATIFSILLAGGTAAAASDNSLRCQNVTFPITIEARTAKFNLTAPSTDLEATEFILGLTQNGKNLSQELVSKYETTSGKYKIAGTYCEPKGFHSNETVQLLTHGIGFDRSYWDFSMNNYNYSYVRPSLNSTGTASFSWDRLGVGKSEHLDPVNQVQTPLEIAALRELTKQLRNGTIPGVTRKFKKVIHVGHSFGSALSYGLAATYPNESDGLVLTGFTLSSQFVPLFAAAGNFAVAKDLPGLCSYADGYLAPSNKGALQYQFFAPGDFDKKVLKTAYKTGQPVAPGELLTMGGMPSPFTGPVLVITGERDVPFCGGNCYDAGSTNMSAIFTQVKKGLSKSTDYQSYIVPGAGHGLNLAYSHSTTYKKINAFVKSIK